MTYIWMLNRVWQRCRLVWQQGKVWPVKNEDVHERICVVDDPAGWFKAAYWASVPAKSIFIHPVDYRMGWHGCPSGTESQDRAMQVDALHVEHGKLWNISNTSNQHVMFVFFSPCIFSLLSQASVFECCQSVSLFLWAAFRGRWHTGDGSSCLDRCWGHTFSAAACVCEVSGMVLTSDARLQRASSIRPLRPSRHAGGKTWRPLGWKQQIWRQS